MVLTNVPGPRRALSVAGTPLGGVLVWAPCSGSIGMSISIFSYAGQGHRRVPHRRRARPRPAGARRRGAGRGARHRPRRARRRLLVERLELRGGSARRPFARLTFSVGVSSPAAWERSWSSTAKRLICSIRATLSFTSSTASWSTSCTARVADHRRQIRRHAGALGERVELVRVERQQRHEVRAVVAVDDGLRDPARLAQRGLEVRRADVLAARRDDQVLLAPGDGDEAVRVDLAEVAGLQPAGRRRCRASRPRRGGSRRTRAARASAPRRPRRSPPRCRAAAGRRSRSGTRPGVLSVAAAHVSVIP